MNLELKLKEMEVFGTSGWNVGMCCFKRWKKLQEVEVFGTSGWNVVMLECVVSNVVKVMFSVTMVIQCSSLLLKFSLLVDNKLGAGIQLYILEALGLVPAFHFDFQIAGFHIQ